MYTYHDIVCMVHPITLLVLKDFEILLGIPELGTWLACAVYNYVNAFGKTKASDM